ncbi:hypothetical protein BaRGS_00004996 [Batillaria attramentaria]|uniref:CCHC-type domain-containing protein n=1 Tax=Batillaria attramentaria TaxID=370345 RepID=A0ABD0LWT6_9CAEN
MAVHSTSSTGYGPSRRVSSFSTRLIFDGEETHYEQWEIKFLGYMKLQKLKNVILTPNEVEVDADKNEEAFAELIQFLDDKSLALVMRDACDDGRRALQILRQYYAGSGTPRVISLYTELTSLVKKSAETITEYIIRAETAAVALRNAGETVTDSLLIAMALKGLPDSYQSFVAVMIQNEKKQTFAEFKAALRSFEETERSRATTAMSDDAILKSAGTTSRREITCYNCGKQGHMARNCSAKSTSTKMWCNLCKKNNHTDKTCRKQKRQKADTCKVNEATDFAQSETEHFAFKANVSTREELKAELLLVDCGATTHILNDVSKFDRFDESFKPDKHYIELANGERCTNVAMKRGDATMQFIDTEGRYAEITLKNALYVPSYPQSIFSVQAATERGASVAFSPESAELECQGTKFEIEKHGRLYYLNALSPCNDSTTDDAVNYIL